MKVENAVDLENRHVHEVYEAIAGHFSSTRFKPWPVVVDFLNSQQQYSIGADIGCGNGKYIGVNQNVYIIGSDRTKNLVEIVKDRKHEVVRADALDTGFKSNQFDFCISIAVIHHFASPQRRRIAIEELLRIVRPGGTILIYVWAMEQEDSSKRKFETQDEMVTWKKGNETFERYYHLFVKGELDNLCIDTEQCEVIKSGYDRDNHYVIVKKRMC